MPQHQWIERLIHYQYVADLLQDRRVLEIGCGAGHGSAFVAKLAREVVALDTSSVELAGSRAAFDLPNLTFLPGEPDRLQLETHSFDVVLVPELQRWITRGSFIPELQRVLVPGGRPALRGAERRPRGRPGHGLRRPGRVPEPELLPRCGCSGEIPFHGTTVAEFEPEGEPEPQIDASLVEHDEPPTHYLALCSDRSCPSLGYTILQVPGRRHAARRARRAARQVRPAGRGERRGRAEARRAARPARRGRAPRARGRGRGAQASSPRSGASCATSRTAPRA